MNTSEDDRCQRCGSEIPPASTESLCPACLLSGALEPSGDRTATVTMAPGGPHSLYGPSRFPCEFGDYRLLGVLAAPNVNSTGAPRNSLADSRLC